MRLHPLWLVLFTLTSPARGDDAPDAGAKPLGATIEVEIQNLVGAQGTLWLSLHDRAETFPNKAGEAVRKDKVRVTSNPFVYRFENVLPGEYAVSVVHDENDNGKIDTGFFGFPTEGYGASNNPVSIGPPSFAKAKFKVGPGVVKQVIKMRR